MNVLFRILSIIIAGCIAPGAFADDQDKENKKFEKMTLLEKIDKFEEVIDLQFLNAAGFKHLEYSISENKFDPQQALFCQKNIYVTLAALKPRLDLPREQQWDRSYNNFRQSLGALGNPSREKKFSVVHHRCQDAECNPELPAGLARYIGVEMKSRKKEIFVYDKLKYYTNDVPRVAAYQKNILESKSLLEKLKSDIQVLKSALRARSKADNEAALVAAQAGETEKLKDILERVNMYDQVDSNGDNLLLIAVRNSRPETVKMLLETSKFNTEAKDKQGRTALWVALQRSDKEILQMLLNAGASDAAWGSKTNTPLLYCLVNNNLELFELIFSKTKNPNPATNSAGTPLIFMAVELDRKDFVKLILDRGVSIKAKRYDKKGTVLHAASSSQKTSAEMVKMLLDYGAEINEVNSESKTPLHLAAWNGNLKVMEQLLSSGADVKLKDDKSRTAFAFANQKGRELLYKFGAPKESQAKVAKANDSDSSPEQKPAEESKKSNKKWWIIGISVVVLLIILKKR